MHLPDPVGAVGPGEPLDQILEAGIGVVREVAAALEAELFRSLLQARGSINNRRKLWNPNLGWGFFCTIIPK